MATTRNAQFAFVYMTVASELIYSQLCLLASELTAAAIMLQFQTLRLVPQQWAIIIIVRIFALQL